VNVGVMVVLAVLGFVVVVVGGAIAIDWRREARERAQTREAQEGLAPHSHTRTAVVDAVATVTSAGSASADGPGWPQDVAVVGDLLDPAAATTPER